LIKPQKTAMKTTLLTNLIALNGFYPAATTISATETTISTPVSATFTPQTAIPGAGTAGSGRG